MRRVRVDPRGIPILRGMGVERRFQGISGAPGLAVGRAWTLPTALLHHGSQPLPVVGAEEAVAALGAARARLEALADELRTAGRADEGEIFAAQALMAGDPTLAAALRAKAATGLGGAESLAAAGEEQAAALASLGDEYLAARAADVRDVVSRALRLLSGAELPLPDAPVVVVAEDLPPSIAAEIPAHLLLGVALRAGSRTAHAVILARAAGIPCLVAATELPVDGSLDGEEVLLDGGAGTIVLRPGAEAKAAAERERGERGAAAERRAGLRGRAVQAPDGTTIHLLANIGSADDARRAAAAGADGVGLLRSEFLLLERETPPSEAEQVAALRAIFAALGPGRPLTLRLADIGGDKQIPYLHIAPEGNPFLGVRGYRLAMLPARPDLRALFASQVCAALLAAAAVGGRIRIMAPMIAVRDEVDHLIDLVAECRTALADRGEAAASVYPLELGVMIEVPAAALTIATLAAGLDFVSIGTNDLTQYAMAADRVNPALAPLQDAASPGVIALIAAAVAGAAVAGVEVGVCGEFAGSVEGARTLVRLGIRELSMDPAGIDEVREALLEVHAAG